MRTLSSAGLMQRLAKQWHRRGLRIGFVPTMGYLHAGHLSLVRRARQAVGSRGRVVLSIYVNPTQFGPREDFQKYPRALARDKKLCHAAGVDVLFVPRDQAIYGNRPGSEFSTWVVEEKLSQRMEGLSRPGHFRGVTTVVSILFNLVLPDVAVFGAKDYQQAAILQRMVRDLHFPVKLLVAATQRERDGLALSSRNKYLAGQLRQQARALAEALRFTRSRVRARHRLSASRLKGELTRRIERHADARVDYIEFFDSVTFEPVAEVKRGVHLAMAVWIGRTRLIDNARL